MRTRSFLKLKPVSVLPLVFLFSVNVFPQSTGKPLLLQEMTWTDVRDYLKNNDMVIIPMGSTEQHGPHLPLGVDSYLALDISKLISAKTGVVVVPIVLAGYSYYHSGFPGTLSLKPETLEEVYYETAQMLVKYGFRRIMFFNYHGGNNVVQDKVVYRINQTTEATAVAIGYGGPIQKDENQEFFDWHAGVEELRELAKKNPDLMTAWDALFGTPAETKKGGASAELSSNGVWCLSDPKAAKPETGEKIVTRMVEQAVKFIDAWKQAKR